MTLDDLWGSKLYFFSIPMMMSFMNNPKEVGSSDISNNFVSTLIAIFSK